MLLVVCRGDARASLRQRVEGRGRLRPRGQHVVDLGRDPDARPTVPWGRLQHLLHPRHLLHGRQHQEEQIADATRREQPALFLFI